MLKQNFLKRISLFDANQDLTYVVSAVDYGYLKKGCPNPEHFTEIENYFAEENGKGNLRKTFEHDPIQCEQFRKQSGSEQ